MGRTRFAHEHGVALFIQSACNHSQTVRTERLDFFREDFVLTMPNQLASIAPEFSSYASVVRVLHIPECTNGEFLQIYQDSETQQGIGFLDGKGDNFPKGK